LKKICHAEKNATNSKPLQQEISLCLTSRDEFSEADPSISLPESRKMKYFLQFHSFPMTTDQQVRFLLIETPVTPSFFGHSQENSGKKQKKGRRTDAIPHNP